MCRAGAESERAAAASGDSAAGRRGGGNGCTGQVPARRGCGGLQVRHDTVAAGTTCLQSSRESGCCNRVSGSETRRTHAQLPVLLACNTPRSGMRLCRLTRIQDLESSVLALEGTIASESHSAACLRKEAIALCAPGLACASGQPTHGHVNAICSTVHAANMRSLREQYVDHGVVYAHALTLDLQPFAGATPLC